EGELSLWAVGRMERRGMGGGLAVNNSTPGFRFAPSGLLAADIGKTGIIEISVGLSKQEPMEEAWDETHCRRTACGGRRVELRNSIGARRLAVKTCNGRRAVRRRRQY